jgi:peptidoglycan LD-endopeptidase CwlK
MTKIELLEPNTREKVEKMLHFMDNEKIPYKVIETLRSPAVQQAYYAQGRMPLDTVNSLRKDAGLWAIDEATNKRMITWTMKSKHLEGKAIDIVPVIDGKIPWNILSQDIANLYIRIGKIGEAVGLTWGGRWTPIDKFGIGKDAPHFETA